MKKIYLLFLLFSFTTVLAQSLTYTVESTIYVPSNNTGGDFFKFILSGNYSNIVSNYHAVVTTNYSNIVDIKNTNFTLTYSFGCTIANQGNPCAGQHVFYKTAVGLLTDYYMGHGSAYVTRFVPNGLSIIRNKTTDINACEEIELNALMPPHTGDDFPMEAYHWLFKVEGDTQWRDVPVKNNNPIAKFTMQDLLGDDYLDHFGTVDFALGRDQDVYSTNTLSVNYAPGAPVIERTEYIQPTCNGGEKELQVYFNRNLMQNEVLQHFSIVNSTDSEMILYPSKDNITTFINGSYISIKGFSVANGLYDITYQAFLNAEPKGCMKSVEDIKITEPEALKFNITKADNPMCYNNNGEISITAHGGTGDYYYYSLDGGTTTTQFTNKTVETTQNNIITRTGIQDISLPVSDQNKIYNIKVTDTKGCIED